MRGTRAKQLRKLICGKFTRPTPYSKEEGQIKRLDNYGAYRAAKRALRDAH